MARPGAGFALAGLAAKSLGGLQREREFRVCLPLALYAHAALGAFASVRAVPLAG